MQDPGIQKAAHTVPFLKITGTDLFYLALLSLLPLIGAQFGYGNQAEQIPVIQRLFDPDYLPGDFFVDSAAVLGQPRYYYAAFFASLERWVSLPVLMQIMSILSSFTLGLVTFLTATKVFSTTALGAALAATLAVVNASFHLGFAGYLRFDSFQPANIAIPLALFAIYFMLESRYWLGAFFGALASAFHPTIGAEITLLGFGGVGASLFFFQTQEPVRWLALIGAVLLFVLSLIVLWVLPSIGTGGAKLSNEEFFSIIAQFRAPHHYLGLEFDNRAWLQAGAFLATMTALAVIHTGQYSVSRPVFALWAAVLMVLVLCAASLWFVDIQHSRIWVTAQVFRMLMVLKWLGFLYFGWAAGQWLGALALAPLALVAAVVVASADANPYVALMVLITWLGFRLLNISNVLQILISIPVLILAVMLQRKFGIDDQSLRALVALIALGSIYILPWRSLLGTLTAAGVVAASLAGAVTMRHNGIFGIESFRSQYQWPDLSGDEFDIARMAKKVSPVGSVWMIPPDLIVFYTLAERPVVVNFLAIPFEDSAMAQWRARIDALYGPISGGGFPALNQMKILYKQSPNLETAAERYGAKFAILHAETPWLGKILAENDSFKAVQIIDN
ncbi:MAG: DUF6798 domain-containing protein [Paracoccaceae bacterium]